MAEIERTVSFKLNFAKELQKLPADRQAQVMAKIGMLCTDPEPDAKSRKRLRGVSDGLCRLRSGDYRVFYTYDETSVSLFSVRARSDDTYDRLPDAELLAHGGFQVERSGPTKEDFQRWITPQEEATPLPEAITVELLEGLEVPKHFWRRLTRVETQEELLECPGVPDEWLLVVDRHMFEKPLERIAEEPTLVAVDGVDDLLRYARGEMVSFLLELDPEQRKVVSWALEAEGPTLVKGGPGTGKSTVALYRAREMIRVLKADGVQEPRILFTTYTNALVTFSSQLLEALLGADREHVEVRTADSLVGSILGRAGEGSRRPDRDERTALREEAWASVTLGGNALQRGAQRRALDRLGPDYVFEEIETVIQGRGLHRVEEYLEAPRPGRRIGLRESARRSVWAVHEAYAVGLLDAGVETWQQARARAASMVLGGTLPLEPYDAVIVDETQDLDASAIRMLVGLCRQPNRLFLTADENQSIYASGFGWKDVHEHLQFVGRTSILSSNHRSTEEIMEGALDYLAAGLPDELAPEAQTYAHSGALPARRALMESEAEADLLARYLRGATRELRLTIGAGAVLVPYNRSGRRVAKALEERGIPAEFRTSKRFEIDDNAVTVLPLRAAKGLEFPVVAVGGLVGTGYPDLPENDPDAAIDGLIRERRTLFVAMTRAMRALLVVTPAGSDSMLFDGFDPELWNVES